LPPAIEVTGTAPLTAVLRLGKDPYEELGANMLDSRIRNDFIKNDKTDIEKNLLHRKM